MVSGNDSVFYVEDIITLGKDIRLWDEFTLISIRCNVIWQRLRVVQTINIHSPLPSECVK